MAVVDRDGRFLPKGKLLFTIQTPGFYNTSPKKGAPHPIPIRTG